MFDTAYLTQAAPPWPADPWMADAIRAMVVTVVRIGGITDALARHEAAMAIASGGLAGYEPQHLVHDVAANQYDLATLLTPLVYHLDTESRVGLVATVARIGAIGGPTNAAVHDVIRHMSELLRIPTADPTGGPSYEGAAAASEGHWQSRPA